MVCVKQGCFWKLCATSVVGVLMVWYNKTIKQNTERQCGESTTSLHTYAGDVSTCTAAWLRRFNQSTLFFSEKQGQNWGSIHAAKPCKPCRPSIYACTVFCFMSKIHQTKRKDVNNMALTYASVCTLCGARKTKHPSGICSQYSACIISFVTACGVSNHW